MKNIEAYLCFPCKVVLNDYFKVTPLYKTAPVGEICPWCQREEALMKFDLTERKR